MISCLCENRTAGKQETRGNPLSLKLFNELAFLSFSFRFETQKAGQLFKIHSMKFNLLNGPPLEETYVYVSDAHFLLQNLQK
jgi:hypothetical protein